MRNVERFVEKELKKEFKDVTKAEWEAVEKMWRAKKKEQPDSDKQDYEDLRLPVCQFSVRIQFIHAFVRLNTTLRANQTIVEVFKCIGQSVAQACPEYPLRPEFISVDTAAFAWLDLLERKVELRDMYRRLIEELGVGSAAGRALVAWKERVNLRFYCDQRLIEDHNPSSPTSYHLFINKDTGDFQALDFNQDQYHRLKELVRLSSVLIDRGLHNSTTNCNFLELPSRTDARTIEGKLDKLVKIVAGSDMLQSRFDLFAKGFPGHADLFVSAMLTIFDVDGVHVDEEDLNFMTSVALQACMGGQMPHWTFARLVLCNSQDKWLDVFFSFGVESIYKRNLRRPREFENRARQIPDTRLKILVLEKLTEDFGEDKLLELLESLKSAHGAFPELQTVPLTEWQAVVKESHVFYMLKETHERYSSSEEQEKQFVFWCLKISEVFGEQEAVKVMHLLSSQESLSSQKFLTSAPDGAILPRFPDGHEATLTKIALSRLIHRLCTKELETAVELAPSTVFRVLCEVIDVARMPLSRQNVAADVESAVFRVLKEVCSPLKKLERSVETIFQIFLKNNAASDQENAKRLAYFQQLQAVLSDPSRQTEAAHYSRMGEDIFKEARNVLTAAQKANPTLKDFARLLAVIDEAIFRKRGFHLRNNQKLAVLAACGSKEISQCGLLQQLATGEGKSLIIMSLAIISVLTGHTVNIVTSSSTLARRDANANTDIYQMFGISAGHICVEDWERRKSVYASSQIIYGDLTSFQRDYLNDTFYGMTITSGKTFDRIIVDEVDSMLLDQGNNMLYLSHEIPDLELLQTLFVRIWQYVSGAIKSNNDEDMIDTKKLVDVLRREAFPSLVFDDLQAKLEVDSVEAENIREHLIKSEVADVHGVILKKTAAECSSALKSLKNAKVETRLSFLIEQALKQKSLRVPLHLKDFVERNLVDFVENAKKAYFMEEGTGYQIDITRTEATVRHEPRVVIIDQATGVDLPSTQWSNGLHQFIQLKHGPRFTPISLKAVFVSNVSFLKKYASIYGFSGTLGADAEQQQLKTLYQVELVRIPSSSPKRFHEEPSEVVPRNVHHAKLFDSTLEKIRQKRSVLIICESIQSATSLSRNLTCLAETQLKGAELRSFKSMLPYFRDRHQFPYGDGKTELPCGKIILATNLAGRGTDIKLSQELEQNGGLHVIMTFLPENVRVEEQALGRAARSGEQGSAQLLVCTDNEHQEANISRMKMHRNAVEAKRILAITNYYERNIRLEEACFEEFTKRFEIHRKDLEGTTLSKEEKQLLQRDLLDQWAEWLDERTKGTAVNEEQIEARLKATVEAARKFCESINLAELKPVKPMNRLRWGILKLLAGQYKDTAEDFRYVKENFPTYAAEAKYYEAFCVIKSESISSATSAAYLKVKSLFEDVKREFDARIAQIYADRAVVECYKKEDTSKVFIVDLFSKQQSELIQMYQMFIASIEDVTGGRLSHEDLMNSFITEEIALKTFDQLKAGKCKEKPIKPPQISERADSMDLETLARAYVTSTEDIKSRIDKLKNETFKDNFLKFFPTPYREEFWEELRRLKCLHDEKTHVFVNKAKLANLNEKLVEKIQKNCFQKSVAKEESVKNEESKSEKTERLWERELSETTFEACRPYEAMSLSDKLVKQLQEGRVLVETHSAVFRPSDSIFRNPESKGKENILGKLKHTVLGGGESEVVQEKEEEDQVQVEDFQKFSFVTQAEITAAGVPKEETEELIDQLIRAKVLVRITDKKNQEELRLVPGACLETSEEISPCYISLLNKLLETKCAYVFAYRRLCQTEKDKEPLKISIPSRDDVLSQMNSLIDCGVLEHSNANFNGLKGSQEGDWIPHQMVKWFKDGDESRNVEDITKKVQKYYTKEVLGGEDFKEWKKKSEGGPYEHVTTKVNTSKIIATVRDKSGMQKYETIDAELVCLWEKMGEANLKQLRSQSLYVMHGATHVIKVFEEAWSVMTNLKLTGVAVLALVQLTIGGALFIYSAGAGVQFANAFVNEGINDLLYSLKGAISGHPGSYKQYKLQNLLTTAIELAVGSLVAIGKAKKFNSVGHALRGPDAVLGKAKIMTLKGGKLIEAVGLKAAVGEAGKQVLGRVGKAVLSFAISEGLQYALGDLTDKLICEAMLKMMSGVKEAMEGEGRLLPAILAALETLGEEKGKALVTDCHAIVFAPNAASSVFSTCEDVYKKYGHFLQSVTGGISQGLSHGEVGSQTKGVATAPTVIKAIEIVPKLLAGLSCIVGMEKRIKGLTSELVKNLEKQTERAKNLADAIADERGEKEKLPESQAKEYQDIANQMIQDWRDKMKADITQRVHEQITCRLISFATSIAQAGIEKAAMAAYRSISELMNQEKLDNVMAKNAKRQQNSQIGEESARQRYEVQLEAVAQSTCSPEIMAQLFNAGVKIDMTLATATAQLLSWANEGKSCTLIIKHDDGQEFAYTAGGRPGEVPIVKTIYLSKEQHYCASKESMNINSGNSCLFDAACEVEPKMRRVLRTDAEFRGALGTVICKTPYFADHIKNGWHRNPIERGYVGGLRKENIERLKNELQKVKTENEALYNQAKVAFDKARHHTIAIRKEFETKLAKKGLKDLDEKKKAHAIDKDQELSKLRAALQIAEVDEKAKKDVFKGRQKIKQRHEAFKTLPHICFNIKHVQEPDGTTGEELKQKVKKYIETTLVELREEFGGQVRRNTIFIVPEDLIVEASEKAAADHIERVRRENLTPRIEETIPLIIPNLPAFTADMGEERGQQKQVQHLTFGFHDAHLQIELTCNIMSNIHLEDAPISNCNLLPSPRTNDNHSDDENNIVR